MKVCAAILLGAIVFLIPWSEANAEVQSYLGRDMERVSCSLATPAACVAAGGRRVDSVGIWASGRLDWRYVGVSSPTEPQTAAAVGVSSFIRSKVLRQSTTAHGEGGAGRGRDGAFRADIFYNSWEAETAEGTMIGANPSIIFGDDVEFAIRVPLYMTEFEGADLSLYHYGVDVSLTMNMSDNFSLGIHGAYTRDHLEEADFSDDTGTLNGGPYVSVLIPLGGGSLTLGAAFEYSVPDDDVEDGDETTVAVGAANFGMPLGESMGINIYGMYYYHTDSELSDYNFLDAGAELALMMGETWAVQIGGRAVLGLDHYDSVEAYLGSEWAF
ncbi:MAG: hypothetical protein QGH42_01595 [Kiritimatiellia bacterium]|jgi:hypothetical protein|nr:hypothetical protein [Kiritimatiellia bacterium]MDP6811536.1 hypothetical protein [Kiritimatiellia bacterium]MDP7022930.1 hypothetical protein [Kiritimatiellia bacterium]